MVSPYDEVTCLNLISLDVEKGCRVSLYDEVLV